MLGYLAGSLFGGKLIEVVKGPFAVIATSLFACSGLWLIDSQTCVFALSGASAIGVFFGHPLPSCRR